MAYLPYLEVAVDVYEAEGLLNQAWGSWQRAREVAGPRDDLVSITRLEAWYSEFRATYVLLELAVGEKPPMISYVGPFVDARTQRQLDALAQGRSVPISAGRVGYWLLPGRYSVAGELRQLQAGSSVGQRQP
jgi:hypothetical protein